jgi:hypothetical protein
MNPSDAPRESIDRGDGKHGRYVRMGVNAVATDGPCGAVVRVVVDPVAQTLTHLVVAPTHHHGLGRLVPIALVAATGDPVQLRCTTAEFDALDDAEETRFLPATNGPWPYSSSEALAWPFYGAALAGGMQPGGMTLQAPPHAALTDRIPVGEVEVRRGEQVHTGNDWIGSVQGLVVDPEQHVTHVLLQEGHLWGRKQVAIPIGTTSHEPKHYPGGTVQAGDRGSPAD